MEDFKFDETTTPQQVIGQLSAAFMDFAAHLDVSEVVIGGIAFAGKNSEGRSVVFTRTTHKDPFACIRLWTSAAEIEADTARQDTVRTLRAARHRIHILEGELRMHGIEVEPEPQDPDDD
jgi:hypothetical protein